MQKSLNLQIGMHNTVVGVCDNNQALLATILAYVAAKIKLDKNVANEKELAQLLVTLAKNSAVGKNLARAAALPVFLDLSRNLASLFWNKGDLKMYHEVKTTKTDLKSVSDDDFVRLCTYYLNVAGQNIADLADRNITVQTLQDNSDLLDNFVYQRQLFIDTKRQHFEVSAQLVKQVKTTNFDLISIDTIMDSLWQTQPVVVGDYYKARNLPSTTSSKLAFKGRVFDSVTGEPLTGAIVTFSLVSASAKAMASGADLVKTVKIKASEGGFQLKTLASGEYTVTVSYYGYTTQEITVYINEGKLTSIAVPLNKLAE